MQERTQWVDTGSGPGVMQRVAANTIEARRQTVYRAYLDHVQGCAVCLKGTNCDTAEGLWADYRELRPRS